MVVVSYSLLVACQQTELDPEKVNGAYNSQCCGTIKLDNDAILLQGETPIKFSFGRDNIGYFLLPHARIGIKNGNVVKLAGAPLYVRVTVGDNRLMLAVENESRDELYYFYR